MDPAALVPGVDAIPVNWIWFQILLILTTFMHLVAVDIMLGSGVIAFVTPLIKGESMLPMSREIAGTLPYSIAFAINFGVAPLLFLQVLYGHFFYTSSVLMAVFWLSIVFLLIVSYYSVYLFNLRYDRAGHNSLLLGLSVFLLMLVAFVVSNNISLMQTPESWLRYFDNRGGTMLSSEDIVLLPRYIHFMTSSIAVGGLMIAAYYEFKRRRGAEDVEYWISYGSNWFTLGTIINFGVGFWFFSRLYGNVIDPAEPSGKLFVLFVIGAVVTIMIALISAQVKKIYKAVSYTLATILLMVMVREIARNTYLRDYVNLSELPVTGQYSPLFVFLVVFAGVGCLIWWMLKRVYEEMEVKS